MALTIIHAAESVDLKRFFSDLNSLHNLLDDYAHNSRFDKLMVAAEINNYWGGNDPKEDDRRNLVFTLEAVFAFISDMKSLLSKLREGYIREEKGKKRISEIELIANSISERVKFFINNEMDKNYLDEYMALVSEIQPNNFKEKLNDILKNEDKTNLIEGWSLSVQSLYRDLKLYFDFTDPDIWMIAAKYINKITILDYLNKYINDVRVFNKYELVAELVDTIKLLDEENARSLFNQSVEKLDVSIRDNISKSTINANEIEEIHENTLEVYKNIVSMEQSIGTNKYGLAFENQYIKSSEKFQLFSWLVIILLLAAFGGGYIIWTILELENLAQVSTITTSVFVLSAITRVSVIPILLIVIWFFINQYNKQKFIIEEYAHKKTLVFAISTFQDNLKDEQSHVKDHFFKSFFDALSTSPIQAFMQKNQKSESEILVDLTREVLTSHLKPLDSATIINSTIKASDNPDKAGKGS